MFSTPIQAGLIGFGAFGQLAARHLAPHMPLVVHDPAWPPGRPTFLPGVTLAPLAEIARCPVIILAVPVSALEPTVRAIAPHVRPGTLVLDVGSVKVGPAEIMRRGLPPEIDIVATHPLFGPQSAANGIAGLKIAVCPVRGRRAPAIAAFLRRLGLRVIMTTPEEHDREAALVQGLTHLIAKVLVQMEPLPTRMTTRSFELLMQGVDMVRDDSPEVLRAIEQANPYAKSVRQRFFRLAAALDQAFADEGAFADEPAPERTAPLQASTG